MGHRGVGGGPPALGDLAGLGGIPDVNLKDYSWATLSSELRRGKSWNISPFPVHMTIEHSGFLLVLSLILVNQRIEDFLDSRPVVFS